MTPCPRKVTKTALLSCNCSETISLYGLPTNQSKVRNEEIREEKIREERESEANRRRLKLWKEGGEIKRGKKMDRRRRMREGQ